MYIHLEIPKEANQENYRSESLVLFGKPRLKRQHGQPSLIHVDFRIVQNFDPVNRERECNNKDFFYNPHNLSDYHKKKIFNYAKELAGQLAEKHKLSLRKYKKHIKYSSVIRELVSRNDGIMFAIKLRQSCYFFAE